MPQIRCALLQANVSVGALIPNAHKAARLARDAYDQGARLMVCPELMLSGYPPEDLVLKRHFLEDCQVALDHLAQECPRDAVVIVGVPFKESEGSSNAAAILHGGKVVGVYRKMLLPNYGVFDEKRVFQTGARPLILDLGGTRVGLHICEDSWFTNEPPCTLLREAGVDLVVNISASPYHRGKSATRRHVMGAAAKHMRAPLLYCNLVGGQDELVFDGASMVFDASGDLVAKATAFAEDTLLVDLDLGSGPVSNDWKGDVVRLPTIGNAGGTALSPRPSRNAAAADDLGEVWSALRMGLRDYVDKNGFRGVVVAVSGGIDSALVLAIAVDALGAERVKAVTMPSRFSSEDTISDAHLVARNLGVELTVVPIRRLHELYLEELTPLWPGRPLDTTEENIQARIRGNIIMALSNKFGWLVLTTGNKSELATGYCTLYGDMAGGFAVIKDCPKTLVFALSRWWNAHGRAKPPTEPSSVDQSQRLAGTARPTREIPTSTIDRAPSAELRENQKDQDSLPPYEVLDQILERYVERDESADDIVADGFDLATVSRVIRLVDSNEYKRRQGAPGVKITPKAFGRDRRLPITNLYSERVKPQRHA